MGLDPHATGCAWCSCRRATAPPTWCRSPGQPPRRTSTKLLADGSDPQDLHFARFDLGVLSRTLRRHAGAGLLHQDRLAAGADLYRQARPEGPGAGGARHRPVEAAAAFRLGRRGLSDAQVAYAASDVLHLHALKEKLGRHAHRAKGRPELAAACFRFLPDRVRLDLAGWAAEDVFAHS